MLLSLILERMLNKSVYSLYPLAFLRSFRAHTLTNTSFKRSDSHRSNSSRRTSIPFSPGEEHSQKCTGRTSAAACGEVCECREGKIVRGSR